jgi:hypothetical protein
MNSETVNIAEIINSVSKYMRTFYLDELVAREEYYNNVFFVELKSRLPFIFILLVIFALLVSLAASLPKDYDKFATVIETREKVIKKALGRFAVYSIVTILLGYIIIPFAQACVTRAYDRTVEALEQMEDQGISDIDLATVKQSNFEDIKDSLITQMENVDNCSRYLLDIMALATISYAIIALFGLISIFNLIVAVELYVLTYINKRYRRFRYVL